MVTKRVTNGTITIMKLDFMDLPPILAHSISYVLIQPFNIAVEDIMYVNGLR